MKHAYRTGDNNHHRNYQKAYVVNEFCIQNNDIVHNSQQSNIVVDHIKIKIIRKRDLIGDSIEHKVYDIIRHDPIDTSRTNSGHPKQENHFNQSYHWYWTTINGNHNPIGTKENVVELRYVWKVVPEFKKTSDHSVDHHISDNKIYITNYQNQYFDNCLD